MTFKVVNADGEDHAFSINGAQSAFINAGGGKMTVKVTFTKRGLYAATCPDTLGIGGLLTIK